MSDAIKLEILRPDKEPKKFEIEQGVYTIGSDNDCRLHLPHPDIEGRHAILTIRDNEIWIEDLDAQTGTTINQTSIEGRQLVRFNQEIGIGPFILILRSDSATNIPAPAAPPPTQEQEPKDELVDLSNPEPAQDDSSIVDTEMQQIRSIKQQIHKELVERLDIKRLSTSRVNKEELSQKALETIKQIVSDVQDKLPPHISPEVLAKDIYNEALKLGPLEEFIEDSNVSEIMVNGPDQIYVEKNGKLQLSGKTFMDDTSVMAIIERIVSPIGRRIDESQPYVDARLHDGSRVNAIIHPLSLIGPCLTIRKFSKIPFSDKDLIGFGTLTPDICEFAKTCILMRKNIIVSGGTGSGKTSLLNVLSNYIPDTERILTIEDAAELRMGQDHVIRLEARPPNIEGKGAVTIRDLVRNALRMRPDRIVVGECRGGEALDMLQAMNTGHDGSLTTVHANTPRDVISRLETMVLMSGMELPVRAIREQVAAAIDLIVHESRLSDGSRKVTKVTEVVGLEGDQITMQDIFEFKQTGIDENGKVIGGFRATGSVPTFLEEIESRGLTIDRSMFNPKK